MAPGLWLLAAAATAATPDPAKPVEYRWDPVVDTSITVVSAGTWLVLSSWVEPGLPARSADPTLIHGLDKLALGRWDPVQARISDLLVGGSVATGLLLTGLEGQRDLEQRLVSTALVVESITLTEALTNTLKHAVDRPRPFTLITDPPADVVEATQDSDAWLSFPSGHTSMEASAAFSVATLLVDRGVDPLPTYLGATALTATVASLRVGAGKHYPSDVLVGAMLGAGVGLCVPRLHRVEPGLPNVSVAPPATKDAPPTVNVNGVW